MIRFFVIVISVVLALGCERNKIRDNSKANDIEEESIQPKYCENQLRLITADSVPNIEIDFNLHPDTLLSLIEDTLKYDLCDHVGYFGLYYDIQTRKAVNNINSIPLAVRVQRYCNRINHFHPQIIILMNAKGQLMIENELVSKESLETLVSDYYFDASDPDVENEKKAYFLLHWDKEVNRDSLTSVFSSVVDGYLLAVNRYSRQLFGKNTCELTERQARKNQERMPFILELTLGNSDFIKPPHQPVLFE